ncbi:MAG: DUF58 domain-containing protein [Phycisphaerales bacterium]|jgi:uncharacterized protein (DUF58 family)|nr:DUF58 domain-containing protein [Phycisphaerales bacterium]
MTRFPEGPPPAASRPTKVDDLIDGHLMARLDHLDVVSRKIFNGRVQGERRSKRRGQSVEFADFRPYVHGDDLRFVDWNIYGRLDRLFLKIFLEEEDLSMIVVVDASSSMHWGDPAKFDYARRLAMALGYIGLVNQNRVSLAAFGGVDEEGEPAGLQKISNLRGRRRTHEMGRWLLDINPGGAGGFEEAMRRIALTRQGRGVMIVLSDFFQKDGFESGLRYVSGRGYDVHAMQILAPQEIEPGRHGMSGDLRLVDLEDEDEAEVTVNAAVLRGYRERLDAYCGSLRDYCIRRSIMHTLVDTSTDLDALLLDYLRKRGLLR